MGVQVLALDIAGTPFRWLDIERASYYVASGKVAWSLGDYNTLRGGVRRIDGARSRLDVPAVIALAKSESMARHYGPIPLGHDNRLLFRRDRDICAYCGERITDPHQRTRDHVIPRARGGRDVWANVVTAHRSCNMAKGCRTPEEAGKPLLYVPYSPCRFEHFILAGRNIVADQMEYLAARLPSHSRAV